MFNIPELSQTVLKFLFSSCMYPCCIGRTCITVMISVKNIPDNSYSLISKSCITSVSLFQCTAYRLICMLCSLSQTSLFLQYLSICLQIETEMPPASIVWGIIANFYFYRMRAYFRTTEPRGNAHQGVDTQKILQNVRFKVMILRR